MICKLLCLTALLLSYSGNYLYAQDTVRITLQETEQKFIQANLSLLAQKYNIDVARAQIIQAKLFPNPYLFYTNAIRNTNNNNKYFDFSKASDNSPQISQLILLAGKRRKQVGMAETNTKLAEDVYLELLRTLKYTLRTDFFSIYYLQRTAIAYTEEIAALKKIVSSFASQLAKGFIAKTEYVRVQALLYSLQSEYNDLRNQINDTESEMRLLLRAPGIYIVPVVDSGQVTGLDPLNYPLATLLDSAAINRPDLMIARQHLELSNQNYKYQKALAIPDITVVPGFVQASNFIHDEFTYGIGLSVPLFNRNQGNIKSAKFLIESDRVNLQRVTSQYEENVFRAFEKAIAQHGLYTSLDKNFPQEMEALSKTVLDNYLKRNIGILEFLNFYDSYKQSVVQLNNILSDLANAYANIDYMTGTDFFYK